MDYRYLKAFVLTAKYGSFSRAGAELRIAQSAVSRQIRLLEQSLNCQLLTRSPQRVEMTLRGRALYDRALQFDQWSDTEFLHVKTTIRIGVIPGVLDSFLINRIAKFKGSDAVNFQIQSAPQPLLAMKLKEKALDVCIGTASFASDEIVSQKLFNEDLVLVSKGNVDMTALDQYRWIHMGSAQYLKKLSKKESPDFIQVDSLRAIMNLVVEGLGIAIVPTTSAALHKNIKTYPLTLTGPIYLGHWIYDIWPPNLREFITFLKER